MSFKTTRISDGKIFTKNTGDSIWVTSENDDYLTGCLDPNDWPDEFTPVEII